MLVLRSSLVISAVMGPALVQRATNVFLNGRRAPRFSEQHAEQKLNLLRKLRFVQLIFLHNLAVDKKPSVSVGTWSSDRDSRPPPERSRRRAGFNPVDSETD